MTGPSPNQSAVTDRPEAIGALPADLDTATREGYRACGQIVRSRAKNFYMGLRLTPEPKRSALFAIYAWMRSADDIADAPLEPEVCRARLVEFRETTRLLLQGQTCRGAGASDRVWLAFIDTIRRFHLRPDEFLHTLDALELDIQADQSSEHEADQPAKPRFATCAGLEDYCYGVASTVGIICMRIWGIRDDAVWDEARPLAIDRGYAFQMTNILRDVRTDYEAGRVYIPAEILDQHALTAFQLATWAKPRECAACIRELTVRAREYYTRSERLDEIVHPDGARPLFAMTRTYSSLLGRIHEKPSCIASTEAVSLTTRSKLSIMASAMLKKHGQSPRS